MKRKIKILALLILLVYCFKTYYKPVIYYSKKEKILIENYQIKTNY